MTLPRGTRVGPYDVLDPLGAGGMGEVYRAWDSRLKREVAVKVVSERFALDASRLARFQREAHVLASLSHPNIATVYAIEEVAGRQALVMELVEGDTLADRLAAREGGQAGLPLRDALMIAQQIAVALEAAHEHGVIHRDLKPSNIIVRNDGTVKVLDFGLATAPHPAGAGADVAAGNVTLTAAGTPGAILGTPAYMSPEQARGLAVDKRTDIWAFGCVLFELLSGERPFAGDRTSDVFAKILERTPDFDALPAGTPAVVRRLVRRCLEKNPEDRLRSAGDAALDIREALLPSSSEHVELAAESASVVRRWLSGSWLAYVGAGAAAATLAAWFVVRAAPSPALPVVRTSLTPPELAGVDIAEGDRLLAITPDGSHVIFAGNHGQQLFVRPLEQLKSVALTAPSFSVRTPFPSPDGQWVGYVESNFTLKKVPMLGGLPVTIITMDGPSRGASWAADDTIIFATSNTATGLQRVPAGGGSVTVLTRPDSSREELDHVSPEVLPGGRAALMTILATSGRMEDAQIAIVDLVSGAWTPLLRGGYSAHYLTSGYLIYTLGGELHAVAFDLDRLQIRGAPQRVMFDLATIESPYGSAHFDIAANGTLVYLDAARALAGRAVVWVDRTGQETPLTGLPPRPYALPRLSPDGTRLVLYIRDLERDLWIWDFRRSLPTRLTFGPGIDSWPVWISNEHLVFGSLRTSGTANVFVRAADGTGSARQLTEGPPAWLPIAAVPDGSAVIVAESPTSTASEGWKLRLLSLAQGKEDEQRLELRDLDGLNTRFNERNGSVSPDGRWLAYDSDSVGGRFEIFVRPFPDVGAGMWQISSAGGQQPVWAPNGGELFFLSLDGAMMAAAVDSRGGSFRSGSPTQLFRGDYVVSSAGNIARHYDVSSDGRRFLMLKDGAASPQVSNQIVVVQNWSGEVKRLVRAP